MPIYEYECTRCGHEFEEERSISAPPRQRCPRCRGRVQKLVSQPAILFKGSGFYVTDHRSGGKNGKRPHHEPTVAESAGAGDGGSSQSAPGEAKPAQPAKAEAKAAKKKESKVA